MRFTCYDGDPGFRLRLRATGKTYEKREDGHGRSGPLVRVVSHAFASSAAEPALRILLTGLKESNDRIRVEILDILPDFVGCHDPAWPRGENSRRNES